MIISSATVVSPYYEHKTTCEIKLHGINNSFHTIDSIIVSIKPKFCSEYFYIIGVKGCDKYQIGMCSNIDKQMVVINDGCPFDIYLKFYCPYSPVTANILEKYKNKKQKGQWYIINAVDMDSLILSLMSSNDVQKNDSPNVESDAVYKNTDDGMSVRIELAASAAIEFAKQQYLQLNLQKQHECEDNKENRNIGYKTCSNSDSDSDSVSDSECCGDTAPNEQEKYKNNKALNGASNEYIIESCETNYDKNYDKNYETYEKILEQIKKGENVDLFDFNVGVYCGLYGDIIGAMHLMEKFSEKNCMFCDIIHGLCKTKKLESIKIMYDLFDFKCHSYYSKKLPEYTNAVHYSGGCYEGIKYCCKNEIMDIINYITKKDEKTMIYVRRYAGMSHNTNMLPMICNPEYTKSILSLLPKYPKGINKNFFKYADYANTLLDIYGRHKLINEIENSYGNAGLNPVIARLINIYRWLKYKNVPYQNSCSKQLKIDFLALNLCNQIINKRSLRANNKVRVSQNKN